MELRDVALNVEAVNELLVSREEGTACPSNHDPACVGRACSAKTVASSDVSVTCEPLCALLVVASLSPASHRQLPAPCPVSTHPLPTWISCPQGGLPVRLTNGHVSLVKANIPLLSSTSGVQPQRTRAFLSQSHQQHRRPAFVGAGLGSPGASAAFVHASVGPTTARLLSSRPRCSAT